MGGYSGVFDDHSQPAARSEVSRARRLGAEVAELDPLRADRYFERLPQWNTADEPAVVEIFDATSKMVPKIEVAQRMSPAEATAALRDLGMMASSLARHGIDPVATVDGLEDSMLALGRIVDMVPRDTVYHYGFWNPRGPRERSFTGASAEAALIDAARTAAPAIDAALDRMCTLVEEPLDAPGLGDGFLAAAAELEGILTSIEKARKLIPPRFFAQTLRPYFADLKLGGRMYNGASAAPLSICIVDHLLWSSDCSDDEFRQFQAKQIRYNMPQWRALHAETLGRPSLVTRLLVAQDGEKVHYPEAVHGALELLHVLVAFRGRHRFVARRAYDERVRKFEVGSGGYGTNTLEHILGLTHAAYKQLSQYHHRGLETMPLEATA